MSTNRSEAVVTERSRLRACSMHYLRMEVKRSHKVFDTSGLTKADLVLQVLTDRFGEKAVSAALAG